MLHKGVGDEDEVAREPTARGHTDGGQEMITGTESFLTPDQRADKRALQEKCKHPLHGQRLTDNSTCIAREVGPVRAELKFHGNAGHHAHGKVQAKNLGPKSNGLVVLLVTGAQGAPFPINQEPCQAHRQLRKQVMVSQREAKL